jgi:hypothetical protein
MFNLLHWLERSYAKVCVGVFVLRHMKANVLLLSKCGNAILHLRVILWAVGFKQAYSSALIANFVCVIRSSISSLYITGNMLL